MTGAAVDLKEINMQRLLLYLLIDWKEMKKETIVRQNTWKYKNAYISFC